MMFPDNSLVSLCVGQIEKSLKSITWSKVKSTIIEKLKSQKNRKIACAIISNGSRFLSDNFVSQLLVKTVEK